MEQAVALPFEKMLGGELSRLYTLKGDVVSAGVKHVTGISMPISEKRRFQDGARAGGLRRYREQQLLQSLARQQSLVPPGLPAPVGRKAARRLGRRRSALRKLRPRRQRTIVAMSEVPDEGEKPSPGCGTFLLPLLPPLLWISWVICSFKVMGSIAMRLSIPKLWKSLLLFPGGLILAGLGGFAVLVFVTIAAKKQQARLDPPT